MGRPKTEINPKRAERLKELIKAEGITQTQFAGSVGMSQQNISRIITKKHALTEETARTIIDHYPKYPLEWLLGYEDYMTVADKLVAELSQAQEESDFMTFALIGLARLSGFTVDPAEQQSDNSPQSVINAIKKSVTFSRDGRSVSLSLAELNDFENELCDYVEMRLKHMIK